MLLHKFTNYLNLLEDIALIKAGESVRFFKAIQFLQNYIENFILIGGLSVSFFSPARLTHDVDVLVEFESDINNLFSLTKGSVKWVRKHAFIFEDIEVEVLSPEFLKLPIEVSNYIFSTKITHSSGLTTPSPEGVILLKLYAFRDIDKQDIYSIIKTQGNSLNFRNIKELLSTQEQREFIDKTLENLEFILNDNF